jgi:hypothetical protein
MLLGEFGISGPTVLAQTEPLIELIVSHVRKFVVTKKERRFWNLIVVSIDAYMIFQPNTKSLHGFLFGSVFFVMGFCPRAEQRNGLQGYHIVVAVIVVVDVALEGTQRHTTSGDDGPRKEKKGNYRAREHHFLGRG